jgi:redox-sensing transcriptional repressor
MEEQISRSGAMSLQTFKRLSAYYNYLRDLRTNGEVYVSSPSVAKEMGLNEVQVRKDLAAVSRSPGKPRKGFDVEDLLDSIGECLGYNNSKDAVLVGAGKLGQALLSYKGFAEHGMSIVAAFDNDKSIIGAEVAGKNVFPMSKLSSLCRRMNIHIGIITVPARQAQEVCDILVKSGIWAIWNFAPVHLKAPEDVLVQNENMAAQLALLSRHLAEKLSKKKTAKTAKTAPKKPAASNETSQVRVGFLPAADGSPGL